MLEASDNELLDNVFSYLREIIDEGYIKYWNAPITKHLCAIATYYILYSGVTVVRAGLFTLHDLASSIADFQKSGFQDFQNLSTIQDVIY